MPPGPPRPATIAEAITIAQRALEIAEGTKYDQHTLEGNFVREIGVLHKRLARLERASADTPPEGFASPARGTDLREPRERLISSHDLEAAAERAAELAIDKAEATGRHNIPIQVSTPSERVRMIVKAERDKTIVSILGKIAIPIAVALSLLTVGLLVRDCQHGTVPPPGIH